MNSDMSIVNKKLMLAGLYLSKFSREGLDALGYATWQEAYNSLAFTIGGKPTSVKMYRQEFDPFFPNGRKGWRNREIRQTRQEFLEEFGSLDLNEFTQLVKTQFAETGDVDPAIGRVTAAVGLEDVDVMPFAKRMLTGAAAENYFEANYRETPRFADCELLRTTNMGCGFDFKLTPPGEDFLAVEVKGIRHSSGQILLTEKEFRVAEYLRARFYLYVVTNFSTHPVPKVIEDPLSSGIDFQHKVMESTSKVWVAHVAA